MADRKEKSDDARKSPNGGGSARERPICWAFDGEGDSALVPFLDRNAAESYATRQNDHQGRTRWSVVDDCDSLPDRPDGTPALVPLGCRISIGGFQGFDCAQALEVAGALAHAAAGRRRIAGYAIATPVEHEVDLEVEDAGGRVRAWRFLRRDARLLAARMATLAVSCLPVVDGADQ